MVTCREFNIVPDPVISETKAFHGPNQLEHRYDICILHAKLLKLLSCALVEELEGLLAELLESCYSQVVMKSIGEDLAEDVLVRQRPYQLIHAIE